MDEDELCHEVELIRSRNISFLRGYYSDAFTKGLKASWRQCTDKQAEIILDEILRKIKRSGADVTQDDV